MIGGLGVGDINTGRQLCRRHLYECFVTERWFHSWYVTKILLCIQFWRPFQYIIQLEGFGYDNITTEGKVSQVLLIGNSSMSVEIGQSIWCVHVKPSRSSQGGFSFAAKPIREQLPLCGPPSTTSRSSVSSTISVSPSSM